MKKLFLSVAVLFVLSFSLAFSSSADDKKSESKQKCPYLQQQSQSVCPYSGKSFDDNSKGQTEENCPYLNEDKSGNNSCPYLNELDSKNSNSKSIKQVWKETKS